jgi:hypothetical protein
MLYYVSHKYGGNAANVEMAKRITHDLQTKDLENCYLCPLIAFSHIEFEELDFEEKMDLCIDILQECDTLIVASEITNGMQKELDFAKLVGMEVFLIDKDGELQPFPE